MKWFDGPIPEAIQVSKQKGVLFVVYIYGKAAISDYSCEVSRKLQVTTSMSGQKPWTIASK